MVYFRDNTTDQFEAYFLLESAVKYISKNASSFVFFFFLFIVFDFTLLPTRLPGMCWIRQNKVNEKWKLDMKLFYR